MISASTSSLSKVEFSPSLSEVVTRVWPWSSSHFRMPSSFWVVPRSSGTCKRARCQHQKDPELTSYAEKYKNVKPTTRTQTAPHWHPFARLRLQLPYAHPRNDWQLLTTRIQHRNQISALCCYPALARCPSSTIVLQLASDHSRSRQRHVIANSQQSRLQRGLIRDGVVGVRCIVFPPPAKEKGNVASKWAVFHKRTSSACLPPSYRTNRTLTFSRIPVSIRIDVIGPSALLRRVEAASGSRDATPPTDDKAAAVLRRAVVVVAEDVRL